MFTSNTYNHVFIYIAATHYQVIANGTFFLIKCFYPNCFTEILLTKPFEDYFSLNYFKRDALNCSTGHLQIMVTSCQCCIFVK